MTHHRNWRPHHVEPRQETVRVIQAVKNFAAISGVCHIGLGVTATNNMKVLRSAGINCESWAAQTAQELWQKLEADEGSCAAHGITPVSHVIISSPAWVQPTDFKRLCLRWPHIQFVQLSHSGCAFLSIDKYGIRNIRECIGLSLELHNLKVAANNTRVVDWFMKGLGDNDTVYLPNLYDCSSFVMNYPRNRNFSDTLRIGSFGAGRPWKNQLTAAEAAVQLARQLGVKLELYVNSKRPDGGERMIESRKELFHNMRGCSLVEVPWESWATFRQTCGQMHILFQPSFDETFNVVTADGIAAGVASVTAPSIEWTPRNWWCEPCDPGSMVRTALHLLHDEYAVDDAREQLMQYVDRGLVAWKQFLFEGR